MLHRETKEKKRFKVDFKLLSLDNGKAGNTTHRDRNPERACVRWWWLRRRGGLVESVSELVESMSEKAQLFK